jgi:hypothetical protein
MKNGPEHSGKRITVMHSRAACRCFKKAAAQSLLFGKIGLGTKRQNAGKKCAHKKGTGTDDGDTAKRTIGTCLLL